jgi:tRNA pseudouridine13 synthase
MLTTPDAAQRLAKAVGCAAGKVGWAGLKDKHAVTMQMMSVPAAAKLPEQCSGPGWTAKLIGWSDEELSAASIEGNHFEIVIRDLSRPVAEEMASRKRILTDADGEMVVVNYFGEQRFASARHGKGFAGARLIRGDFDGALKLLIGTPARKDSGKRHEFTRAAANLWGNWGELLKVFPRCAERGAIEKLAAGGSAWEAFASLPYLDQQMAVEAYQSHLWNRMVERLVVNAAGQSVLTAPDAYGNLAFAHLTSEYAQLKIPLPASDVRVEQLDERVVAAMEEALRVEGVRLEELHVPQLRRPAYTTIDRPLWMQAREVQLSAIEPDEMSKGGKRCKRTLTCRLGTGSYATVVLRALGQ